VSYQGGIHHDNLYYVFKVEGGPHLLQSCLCVIRNSLPSEARKMHLSFESLVIIGAPSLQGSLMDIHHDTSFRPILEDDSTFSTSKAHIHFCSAKGMGLWLIVKSSIHSFHITHSTFISTLNFCLGLI
jgi:hypothetical protein